MKRSTVTPDDVSDNYLLWAEYLLKFRFIKYPRPNHTTKVIWFHKGFKTRNVSTVQVLAYETKYPFVWGYPAELMLRLATKFWAIYFTMGNKWH